MGCGHHVFPRPCSPALNRLLRGVQRCSPGGANTPHLLCAAGPVPAREDKPRVGWSGQASWRRWELVVRDGRGKRTDVPGLRRGAEVEGGGPTGELSQVPVGVQDVSLCSILPALTSLVGCRGWGCLAWAAFRPDYRLSLPSQDASGAGPGESGTWAFSAVILVGGHPGPSHGGCRLRPKFSAPGPQGLCALWPHLPPASMPPPLGAVLVSVDTASGVGTGPSLPRVPSAQALCGADICAPSFSCPPCPGGSELGKRRTESVRLDTARAAGQVQANHEKPNKPVKEATFPPPGHHSQNQTWQTRSMYGWAGQRRARETHKFSGMQPGPLVSPERPVARSAVDPAPVSNGRNAWSPAPRSAPPQIPRCLEEDT